MRTIMKRKDFKEDILDYLNGHLSEEQTKEFETELANSTELSNELKEAKDWQTKLQSSNLDAPMPQFSSFEGKLKQTKQIKWNLSYGLSTTAAVALVALLFVGTSYLPNYPSNNEFETLTDANSVYNVPVMQMVLSEYTELTDIVSFYNLDIIKTYPNKKIIDVRIDAMFKTNLNAIETDKRIVFLKQVGTQK